MSTPKKIRWIKCGSHGRDRQGTVLRTGDTVYLRHEARHGGRYVITVGGGAPKDKDFTTCEAAKRFAEENVDAWITELEALEAERRERAAKQGELERAAVRLRDHGIAARTFDGILISLEAAEALVSKLEDLRRIEERGAV